MPNFWLKIVQVVMFSVAASGGAALMASQIEPFHNDDVQSAENLAFPLAAIHWGPRARKTLYKCETDKSPIHHHS